VVKTGSPQKQLAGQTGKAQTMLSCLLLSSLFPLIISLLSFFSYGSASLSFECITSRNNLYTSVSVNLFLINHFSYFDVFM
jgi:hypothetical protein